MSEKGTSRLPTRGRWPTGFLGLVILVGLVETGLSRIGAGQVSLNAADWQLVSSLATSAEATSADVLCFGDSAIKTGLAPRVIEAETGRSAYNLAALGAPTAASYFLLKRALEAGARPKAIVVDAMEHQLWGTAPRGMIAEWARMIRPGEALELARIEHDPGLFPLYLIHLLPSVLYRQELRAAASDRLAGRPVMPDIHWSDVIGRQLANNRGALLREPSHPKEGPDPRAGGVLSPLETTLAYGLGWPHRAGNMIFLDKFLTLAASRSIPAFLLIPPYHPGVQAERERRGQDATYARTIRRIHDRYSNVVVIDARRIGLDHGQFIDSYHPTAEGAAALSALVGRALEARLREPGSSLSWIELPRWSGEGPQVAAEDMGKTLEIVRSRAATRR